MTIHSCGWVGMRLVKSGTCDDRGLWITTSMAEEGHEWRLRARWQSCPGVASEGDDSALFARARRLRDEFGRVAVERIGDLRHPLECRRIAAVEHRPQVRAAHASAIREVRERYPKRASAGPDVLREPLM